MTKIIQSNRERHSKIDKGLVERLNQQKHEIKPEATSTNPTESNLRFITDKREYDDIQTYMNVKFPDYKKILSDNLKFEDGVMKGSNIYIALAVEKYLGDMHTCYRIATLADLNKNLEFVKGYHVDIGVAVRSFTRYNAISTIQDSAVASLINHVKSGNISQEDLPVFINLDDLHLGAGLRINTFSVTKYIRSESINWPDDTEFYETDDSGLPKKPADLIQKGLRAIYTSDGAISRCMLSENGNLLMNYKKFSNSADVYRIVLAKK